MTNRMDYSDLDRWEDEQTVKDMELSIARATSLLVTLKRHIDSDQYVLDRARERLVAHPSTTGVHD